MVSEPLHAPYGATLKMLTGRSFGFAAMLIAGEAEAANDLSGIYSRLAMLSVSEDINASSFRGEGVSYYRYSLPWRTGAEALTESLSVSGIAGAKWLDVRGSGADNGCVTLHPRWTVAALTGGIELTWMVNDSLGLDAGLNTGVIKMQNRSTLTGQINESDYLYLREEGVLPWSAWMVSVSPSLGIKYRERQSGGDEITLQGGVSWLALLPAGGEKEVMKNGAGTWSLRAEYRFSNIFSLKGAPVDLLLSEQPGGFWGKGYRNIDFGFISETALAAEYPLNFSGVQFRLRVGVGWLKNDKGDGISLILNIR